MVWLGGPSENSVNRTTGTAPDAMMSVSTRPGPTDGRDRHRRPATWCLRQGTQDGSHQRHVTIEVVDDQQSQSSGAFSLRRKPVLGSVSSRRWIACLARCSRIAFGGTAGRCAERDCDTLREKDLRIELTKSSCRRRPVITSTFETRRSEPPLFGYRRALRPLFDPRDRLVGIDHRPRRTRCERLELAISARR